MAQLVLDETGLLPHANAGALDRDELAVLRAVCPSQGMMIESLRPDLDCHRGAPDKAPRRRLDTLEWAGELAIPFTTGILVGIGEDRDDRIEALEAIAASHRRHGHVQEVIVQNFLPKAGTTMHAARPCPSDVYLEAIALARLILPPDVHLQAPPNLSDDFGVLLDAGIDDWGGVSPVTADHVNPERPWPALDRLRAVTEARGFTVAPRLTAHPSYVDDPTRWFDATVRFAVMDRSDAEGLGRDDPGSVLVQRITPAAPEQVDDGIEVLHIGARSTAWYAGTSNTPPTLVPARTSPDPRGAVHEVLDGVLAGQQVEIDEIVTLFSARGPEVAAVAEVADELRRRRVGDTVTFVHNRNINYTNVCTFKCKFCGFSKGPLSLNLRGTPYLLTLDDIAGRAREAYDLGATEVCLQGGIHPDFDGDYYVDVARAVHDVAPELHIHGFTALEVTEGARRLGEPLADYLRRLMEVGLKTLPGTAAEILDDEIRAVLCPDKVDTEEWLHAHRTAHQVGLRSNITIMFGAVERPVHWARHIVRDPGPPDRDRRVHRVRAVAVRPHGHAPLPAAQGPAWPDLPRDAAHARRPADRLRRPDRQHPDLLGEAGPRRRAADPARRGQRRGRHADGREHQPGRRRRPRSGHGRERLPGLGRTPGPHAGAAHHPLRTHRLGRELTTATPVTVEGRCRPGDQIP